MDRFRNLVKRHIEDQLLTYLTIADVSPQEYQHRAGHSIKQEVEFLTQRETGPASEFYTTYMSNMPVGEFIDVRLTMNLFSQRWQTQLNN